MFQVEMNRNPRAPPNFYVENMPPKVGMAPIQLNQNSSCFAARKSDVCFVKFVAFYFLLRFYDVIV